MEALGTRMIPEFNWHPKLSVQYELVLHRCSHQTSSNFRSKHGLRSDLKTSTVLSWASAIIWGWAVTQRTCLNGSTIPTQGPTPDAKLAARCYQIDFHRRFVRDSLRPARQWRKLYCATKQTSLLSFRSIQSSLAVRELCAAGKECCERGHEWVCVNLWCLMSWHPKRIRTIAAMWAHLRIQYARI